MLTEKALSKTEVRCFLTLLPHVTGMKPIHGIAVAPSDTVAILTVGHDLASSAHSAMVYLRVDNLAPAGAAKVVHLSHLLQIILREELG